MQNLKSKINNKRFGIIALATILLISAIILEMVLVTVFVVYTLNSINYGSRLSAEALSAAKSGVDDAFLRLSRDKNSLVDYSLNVGARTVSITVISFGAQVVVMAEGRAFNKYRKLRAVFDVDQNTGVVRIVSQKEVAF